MKKAMMALALGWLIAGGQPVSSGVAAEREEVEVKPPVREEVAPKPEAEEEAAPKPVVREEPAPAPKARPTFGENLRDGAIGVPIAFLRAAGDLGGAFCYAFGSISILGADVVGLVDNNPLTEDITRGILSNRFEELGYVFDMAAAACVEGVNAVDFKLVPMDPDVHLNPAEMMHADSYEMVPLAFKSFGMMFADFGMGLWESGWRLLQDSVYADGIQTHRRDLAESAFGRVIKEYAR